MAEPSINAQLADAFLAEDLRVRRAESAQRRDVLALLLLLEQAIVQAIKGDDPMELVTQAQRLRAVERLVTGTLDPLIRERYAAIATVLDDAMARLAQHAARTVQTVVEDTAEDEKPVALPPPLLLQRRVTAALFPSPVTSTDFSTTGGEWWARQGTSLSTRLGDQLKVSVTLEESLTQMVARVRGTPTQGVPGSVMARARQDAARLLTTQVTNTVGEARVAVAERNAGRMILQHSSVIDASTSIQCLGRHGLRYDAGTHEGIGHDIPFLNGPPYHPNCRSSILTLLDDGGAVGQDSLATWLRRQSPAQQDDVLGPTRARMFRSGTLKTGKDLLDAATGRPLTLDELGA